MPLTDTACKNAKANPNSKPIKLTDEKGMHLLVNGVGKYWRLSYRFDGKQKTLALGTYPEISLKDARNRRDDVTSRNIWHAFAPLLSQPRGLTSL